VLVFTSQPEVVEVGTQYLRVIAYTFIPTGLIFAAAGLFQGLARTELPFYAAVIRLLLFVAAAFGLVMTNSLSLISVWWLAAFSIIVQSGVVLSLASRSLRQLSK
jgi:Na+-driven multidrug efflux pump